MNLEKDGVGIHPSTTLVQLIPIERMKENSDAFQDHYKEI